MSKQTSNPYFDAWLSGSEQLMQAHSDWFGNFTDSEKPVDMTDVVMNAKKNWEQCQGQFESWITASQQWFPNDETQATESSNDQSSNSLFEKLKTMLNPETFLNSGVDEISQVFQRLAESPDFADIGVFEKKFMRASNDWINFQDANAEYQMVITKAWSKAFDTYIKLYSNKGKDDPLDYDDMLKQWLSIANESLIQTQRSDDFLNAQRKVFKTSTQYKVKQREIVEAWCEAYTIPTRTEVDDLHRMVYELRREVRQLQTQIKNTDKAVVELKEKPPTKVAKKRVANKRVSKAKAASHSEDKRETAKL